MIIYGACKSCDNQIIIATGASSRADLIKERGSPITTLCKQCEIENTFDITLIKGRFSTRFRIALFEVGIIGAVVITLSITLLNGWEQKLITIGLYGLPALAYILYTRKNFNIVEVYNKNDL